MADVTQGGTAVVGDTPHDAADTNNRPVKIGSKASTDEPTAVAVDDRVNAWIDTFGRFVMLLGHGNPETPVNVTATATGSITVVTTPGGGLSLHINKMNVMNAGSAKIDIELQDGSTMRTALTLAADGGGANLDYGSRGWKLAANASLSVNLVSASGAVEVNVLEYYIAP